MDFNLRCGEFLNDSPSTSASQNAMSAPQQRRRSAKLNEQNRPRSHPNNRLVLGQLPVNRKRPAPAEKLNTSQHPSVLALSDKSVHQDIRCVESLFKAQEHSSVQGNYFLSVQSSITPKHRQQAIEWLYDVCLEDQCEPDVFPLAVSYIDRFLSTQNVYRENLQALASVCLFIASKVKAPQPLNAKRIAYFTDGAVRQQEILSWELLVLGKLNWNVSTATALDFLDQVAARYHALHPLSEMCRSVVHRIQFDEKFAFLVPSIQAAISLLFAAKQSHSQVIEASAEDALLHILRCDPNLLACYMEPVARLLEGSVKKTEKDTSPGALIAPPSSGVYRSPAATPPLMLPPLATMSVINSSYSTPEHCNRTSDDSGFNSGFSSPAAALEGHSLCRDSSLTARRHSRRSATTRISSGRRSLEQLDSGIITNCFSNEQEFLQFFG